MGKVIRLAESAEALARRRQQQMMANRALGWRELGAQRAHDRRVDALRKIVFWLGVTAVYALVLWLVWLP